VAVRPNISFNPDRPGEQLAGFIGKFEPANAKLIRECRAAIRKFLPTAVELVYDNYNFFVIGYSTTERFLQRAGATLSLSPYLQSRPSPQGPNSELFAISRRLRCLSSREFLSRAMIVGPFLP
jgi:hypothetical protein